MATRFEDLVKQIGNKNIQQELYKAKYKRDELVAEAALFTWRTAMNEIKSELEAMFDAKLGTQTKELKQEFNKTNAIMTGINQAIEQTNTNKDKV